VPGAERAARVPEWSTEGAATKLRVFQRNQKANPTREQQKTTGDESYGVTARPDKATQESGRNHW
jgi:hypothetical protein